MLNKVLISDEKITFNQWVREKRKASGLSVQKLSEKSGVSRPYINKIESGQQKNCSILVIISILEVFGYDLKEACDEIDFGAELFI